MSETPQVRIVSDVGTLKALASGIRRRILSFLEESGQATSADVARALGESSGTTSYHLRLLARHGLVREVESASRRERWWCKVPLDLRFPPLDENVPPAQRDAHLDLHRQRLAEDLAQLSGLLHLDDPGDLAWTRMSRSSVRVTRAQLDELGAEFRALVTRYAAPAADEPASETGEATALIQLRLYAFPGQGSQPATAQHPAGEQQHRTLDQPTATTRLRTDPGARIATILGVNGAGGCG